ncbi:hypothetical protein [Lactiplantibacillus plantarum]|uniref:hypothetical protein n=1 Tax=Lactiplantibacillus plantarum TaxID=1590 RepID=UPI0021A87128|nr:hypothetical protein [Lactiplantibacillus plantarum]
MQTFNHKTIKPGQEYCECLGHKYFYEDSAAFLGWLTGIFSAAAVLYQIGFTEKVRE